MRSDPAAVVGRLCEAMNEHDLEALISCFDPDFQSEQPNHPNRAFHGTDQVRKNWSAIFGTMPDFQAEVLAVVHRDNMVWSEWRWVGTLLGDTRKEMRGVIIFGLQAHRIVSARLYMEPTETNGEDIDASVGRMTQPS